MMQATETVPTDANGRDDSGRFTAGNAFARSNPVQRHAQKLRQTFITAVSEQDIRDIVFKLVELAKGGNIAAANLLLLRSLGKPATSEVTLPLDDEPRLPTREELGPVTVDNFEQHRAALIRELQVTT